MRDLGALAAAAAVLASGPALSEPRYAIIDMHFHADLPDAEGPPGGKACAPYEEWAPRDPGKDIGSYLEWFTVNPPYRHVLTAPIDAVELRERGIAMLRRYNVLALAGGEAAIVEDYRAHADGRVLPAIGFGSSGRLPPVETLRKLHADGKLAAFSEITTQYAGIAPDDPLSATLLRLG